MKLWHLNPRTLPRNVRWMQDADYLDKLGPKEREWYNKFVREYYDGNVPKRGALHKSKTLRRDCYTRKNLQNRDLQSIMDARGKMDRLPK